MIRYGCDSTFGVFNSFSHSKRAAGFKDCCVGSFIYEGYVHVGGVKKAKSLCMAGTDSGPCPPPPPSLLSSSVVYTPLRRPEVAPRGCCHK